MLHGLYDIYTTDHCYWITYHTSFKNLALTLKVDGAALIEAKMFFQKPLVNLLNLCIIYYFFLFHEYVSWYN